jgi:hypothetical protein
MTGEPSENKPPPADDGGRLPMRPIDDDGARGPAPGPGFAAVPYPGYNQPAGVIDGRSPAPSPAQPGWSQYGPDQTVRLAAAADAPGGWYAAPAPPQRRLRPVAALLVALTLVLVLGGGAFAFYKLGPLSAFESGPEAAGAMPAGTTAYVGVNLDPSGSQKVAMLQFLLHFDSFKSASAVPSPGDDVRRRLIADALKSGRCSAVKYQRDLEPWIGSAFGAGIVGANPTAQDAVIAIQEHDESAARRALEKLRSCSAPVTGADRTGYAFANGFVLIASSQVRADRYAASASRTSLSDTDHFKSDLAALGQTGVLTGWADISVLGPGVLDRVNGSLGVSSGRVPTASRAAFTLRFTSNVAELAAVATSTSVAQQPSVTSPIGNLPDDTSVALSVNGGRQSADRAWQRVTAQLSNADVRRIVQAVADRTGLRLPDDVGTLLGDNLLFAGSLRGIDASSISAPQELPFGVRITTDVNAFNEMWRRVESHAGTSGTSSLVRQNFPGGTALSFDGTYADKLAHLDGHLGDTAAFKDAVGPRWRDSAFVAYVNLHDITRAFHDEIAGAEPPRVVTDLDKLRSAGLSVWQSGDHSFMTLRLTLGD